jgi:hypothetical protein
MPSKLYRKIKKIYRKPQLIFYQNAHIGPTPPRVRPLQIQKCHTYKSCPNCGLHNATTKPDAPNTKTLISTEANHGSDTNY